ncbi:hypothetical protein [Sporomusa sphaeroides]|uniref:hypothetical protein n=1 Tax=Sporomusa sphaeroides TaxID=47679 RepID=UPI002B9EE672|nr:hypothetical protein [Sporomusa sphaeroides]HML35224.1 hypothetical protein [Sporomusa sphaeroides]
MEPRFWVVIKKFDGCSAPTQPPLALRAVSCRVAIVSLAGEQARTLLVTRVPTYRGQRLSCGVSSSRQILVLLRYTVPQPPGQTTGASEKLLLTYRRQRKV